MEYILSLDQGTTSSRAIIFDEEARIKACGQKEFPQHFPQSGWVEHAPMDIWKSQLESIRESMANAGISAGEIAAIGITNQRETTLLWERSTGAPVCRAIVWQDRRTASMCEQLQASGYENLFEHKTGLRIDPYFSGTKLAWMLQNVPGARAKAERGELAFGTVDTWLVWNLTGGREHVTDASNASRTLMFNIHTGSWDDELLGLLDIPRAVLPRVVDSSGIVCETDSHILGNSVPIAGIAGDQQAALFGQCCTREGMVKNTYGTGCFMLMNSGPKAPVSANRLITSTAWTMAGKTTYALEGSIFVAGAVVQWLRDGLGLIKTSSEVEALASSVPNNGGVYLVPALVGLGAPQWDPHARGTIIGITRGTTAGHIARAALEGIAFQVADVLDAMRSDTGLDVSELRVDGGAAANDLLMQLQADILHIPVVRPASLESTALGAAFLAGLAVGVWNHEANLEKLRGREQRFQPSMEMGEVEHLRSTWARAVERAKNWELSDR